MPNEIPPRHILIDFENVPATDLAPIAGQEVEITILVGEKNKKLGIALVEQLLDSGPRAHLIRVGASGRNALDLTLTYYLGKATAENPRAEFFIISKDGDYDAMIQHVKRLGVQISRHDSVLELPFLTVRKTAEPAPSREDRLALFVDSLRTHPKNRPGKRATLERHLKTHFGNEIADSDVIAKVDQLVRAGQITITEKGSVTYHL